jgi:hypothetical protein
MFNTLGVFPDKTNLVKVQTHLRTSYRVVNKHRYNNSRRRTTSSSSSPSNKSTNHRCQQTQNIFLKSKSWYYNSLWRSHKGTNHGKIHIGSHQNCTNNIPLVRWSNSWKLQTCLQGKAINWLNYIKDTEYIDISLWSRIKPKFKAHYDIQIQTVDNIRDFYKLKHEEYDDQAGFKLEVSKLMEFSIPNKRSIHICWCTANHTRSHKKPLDTYDETIVYQ